MDVLAQIFGVLALILMVLSYQQKERVRLLRFQMISNALFVASYYLLGAYSGAVMSLANVARSFVFSQSDKKWGRSRAWLFVFIGISMLGGWLTWEGPISILVIIATIILTVALYSKNQKFMRIMFLFPPLLYVSYNLLNKSIGGIGSDIFCMTSAIIAICRFDIKKKKKNIDSVSVENSDSDNLN